MTEAELSRFANQILGQWPAAGAEERLSLSRRRRLVWEEGSWSNAAGHAESDRAAEKSVALHDLPEELKGESARDEVNRVHD